MTIQAEDGREGRKPSDDLSRGMRDSIRDGSDGGNTAGGEADVCPVGRGVGEWNRRLEAQGTVPIRRVDAGGLVVEHEVDFKDLMDRARSGDAQAVRDFLGRFECEVRAMVRGRLPRRMRSRFDSADFVQAVWKSFFADLNDRPCEFSDSQHLRGYLAGVVRNKVNEQQRRLTRTEKYDITREEQLYIRRGDREIVRELCSADPSPSERVQADDRLEQLTSGCSQRDIDVLTLRRHGMTNVEIADRVGLDERSVRRILAGFRTRMEGRA